MRTDDDSEVLFTEIIYTSSQVYMSNLKFLADCCNKMYYKKHNML